MTDLVEWLLAQYDADEQRAGDLHDVRCAVNEYDPKCCDCDYPDELRDDLAAKRAIVEYLTEQLKDKRDPAKIVHRLGCWHMLTTLAYPYADRSGYDERWRPEQ